MEGHWTAGRMLIYVNVKESVLRNGGGDSKTMIIDHGRSYESQNRIQLAAESATFCHFTLGTIACLRMCTLTQNAAK
jgi:hypothetical protein